MLKINYMLMLYKFYIIIKRVRLKTIYKKLAIKNELKTTL